MKVVIIGGGIGGLVAGIALREIGARAVVHEAAEGPAESRGLFLTLAVNGMRVLRSLGADDALLRAGGFPTPRMAFTSTTGRRLGEASNGWLDARTPSLTVMRGRLQAALADEARRRGVEIRYGKRLVGYDHQADAVVARFADGSEASGDVLVGADGIHSRVRALLVPGGPAPQYTGLLNLGGVVPASGLEPTPDTMHMVWGSRAFFGYTVQADGEAWWFANVGAKREPTRASLTSTESREWRARLVDLFSDDPPFIAELVERTGEIGAHAIHDLSSLPTWHRDRAVLLGDAAHAVSPSAGQGASLAMEDALMLAHCLRADSRPGEALAAYEAARRSRAERIVKAGRRRGRYKAPGSRVSLWVRDLVMPLAMRVFARDAALSWVHDYEVRWDGPAGRAAAQGRVPAGGDGPRGDGAGDDGPGAMAWGTTAP